MQTSAALQDLEQGASHHACGMMHVLESSPSLRYQTAVDRNPKDYDALYNWALVLQVREAQNGAE